MSLLETSDFIVVKKLLSVYEFTERGEIIFVINLNLVFLSIKLLLHLVIFFIFLFYLDLL